MMLAILAAIILSGRPAPLQAVDLASLRSVDARTPVAVQIALAESAGPPVGHGAAVYVLGARGYEKVRDSTNGFTCLISRDRGDAFAPQCFDASGTAALVPVLMFTEAQRAAGSTDARIEADIEAGYRSGRFAAPPRPGLVYMLSDYNYVLDPSATKVIHIGGHLMFYAPFATQTDVGSGPGAPLVVDPGTAHAVMIVVPAGGSGHGS